MIYFIGDLHLFARSQTNGGKTNYDGRPFDTVEEMNERAHGGSFFCHRGYGTVGIDKC